MARYAYDPLSYEDNGFLLMETPCNPMHVAGIQIFDTGPLATAEGGVDFASILRLTESILHRIPRYRQKLTWIPGRDRAVWVDDHHFKLDYHMRHTSLPRPGTDAQLKALAERILEPVLDRARPLWETWVVEGLQGDRFAMISKIHHCMIDGMAGVDLATTLQSPSPERKIQPAPRFIPRPHPSEAELLRDERLRRLGLPLGWSRGLFDLARTSEDPIGELGTRARAVRDLLGWYIQPPSDSPVNGPTGPHRRLDWFTLSLEDVKSIRRALGGTVNDVVLTVVTGAMREFLQRRQARPEELDFRVSAPVSVRREEERGQMGNRVASWVVPLPLGETDPLRQLEAISEITRAAKDSQLELGTELMIHAMDALPLPIPPSVAAKAINTFVTNIPGPPFPLYLLGAEVLECYPIPPLLDNMGIAVGVMSYNGRMCFCLIADYDRVPDVGDFADLMERALQQLAEAAGVKVAPPRAKASMAPSRRGVSGGATSAGH